MSAFYNENDPKAAAWLRELVKRGLIADGVVDERSIVDVRPEDLAGFAQVHLFAGIGGWSYALRLAGWPDDRPVWTGSCPCQPFSVAGRGGGEEDERHLWPDFFRLIGERRPPAVFGEQVASPAGRRWLSGVRADLEGVAYAVGAADLCAAGVAAPHIRQRLYWMGESSEPGLEGLPGHGDGGDEPGREPAGPDGPAPAAGAAGGVGDADEAGRHRSGEPEPPRVEGARRDEPRGSGARRAAASAWCDAEVLDCRDGKARRAQPGTFPLAHGIPARVVRLRGYGNAIVPQVAAEFVRAYLECRA